MRYVLRLAVAVSLTMAFAPRVSADSARQMMAGGGSVVGFDFAVGASGDPTTGDVNGHYRFGSQEGPVTCLLVVGNRGVVGGPQKDFALGATFIVAEDGGPNNPDRMSAISTLSEFFPPNEAGCALVLALVPPVFVVDHGNIVVRD